MSVEIKKGDIAEGEKPVVDKGESQRERFLRENREAVEKRNEVIESLESSVAVIEDILEQPNLDPEFKRLCAWTIKSFKDARAVTTDEVGLERTVKAENPNSEQSLERREGLVPIEKIMYAVNYIREKQESKYKKYESSNKVSAEVDASGKSWEDAYESVVEENPEFAAQVDAKVAEWEAIDGGYSDEVRSQKKGDALMQLAKEYGLQEITPEEVIANSKALKAVYEILEKNSKNYFAYHFGDENEKGKNLDKEENKEKREAQHLFTEQEAYFLSTSEGKDFRQMMLDQYKEELKDLKDSKGEKIDFKDLSEIDQNYELGKLALRDRRILDLPKQKEGPPPPPKQVYLINVDELGKRMAWTKAEEQLRLHFHAPGFLKKIAKGAWKGLSENYYRIKFYNQAIEEIKKDNNLQKAMEGRLKGLPEAQRTNVQVSEYYRILDSIVEKFDKDLVNATERGQKSTVNIAAELAKMYECHIKDDWDSVGQKFHGLKGRAALDLYVKEVIAPLYGNEDWGQTGQAKSSGWFSKNRKISGKDMLFASNFFEMAEEYKRLFEMQKAEVIAEHKENAEVVEKHLQAMLHLDVQLGKRERDLYNNRPKGVLKWYENLVDRFEGNRVMGKVIANPFTLGVATALSSRLVQQGLKWATVGGLATAGVLSGAYIPLLAGAAVGGAFKYWKRSKDVKYDIAQEQRQETLGGKGSEILKESNGRLDSVMGFKEAVDFLISIKGKKDLSNDEKEKLAGILARRNRENADGNTYDLFALDENDLANVALGTREVADTELDKLLKAWKGKTDLDLNNYLESASKAISQDIADKEKNIDKFRKKQARISALGGALFGAAGAVVAQELLYKTGAAEYIYGGVNKLGKLLGSSYLEHAKVGGTMLDQIRDQWNGTQGVGETLVSSAITENKIVSTQEYIQSHPGLFKQVQRLGWYDQNTPAPKFDQNELKLDWGGENGVGIDKDGNYVFNIHRMKAGGSYHGKLSVNAQKALEQGNLRMLLSVSKGTQDQVIEVAFDRNGNAIIPKDGETAKMLFEEVTKTRKGQSITHALFKGRYAEVAEVLRPKNGIEQVRILAIHEGKGMNSVISQVTRPGVTAPTIKDYDTFIPLVPPTRKTYERRGEKVGGGSKAERARNPEAAERAERAAEHQVWDERKTALQSELQAVPEGEQYKERDIEAVMLDLGLIDSAFNSSDAPVQYWKKDKQIHVKIHEGIRAAERIKDERTAEVLKKRFRYGVGEDWTMDFDGEALILHKDNLQKGKDLANAGKDVYTQEQNLIALDDAIRAANRLEEFDSQAALEELFLESYGDDWDPSFDAHKIVNEIYEKNKANGKKLKTKVKTVTPKKEKVRQTIDGEDGSETVLPKAEFERQFLEGKVGWTDNKNLTWSKKEKTQLEGLRKKLNQYGDAIWGEERNPKEYFMASSYLLTEKVDQVDAIVEMLKEEKISPHLIKRSIQLTDNSDTPTRMIKNKKGEEAILININDSVSEIRSKILGEGEDVEDADRLDEVNELVSKHKDEIGDVQYEKFERAAFGTNPNYAEARSIITRALEKPPRELTEDAANDLDEANDILAELAQNQSFEKPKRMNKAA